MNTTLSCWICLNDKVVDCYWTVSIRNLLDPFQNHQTTCQFIHHLHHMEFTSSSPFQTILVFISTMQLEDDKVDQEVLIMCKTIECFQWKIESFDLIYMSHWVLWILVVKLCSKNIQQVSATLFLDMSSTPAKSSNNKIAKIINRLTAKTPAKKATKVSSFWISLLLRQSHCRGSRHSSRFSCWRFHPSTSTSKQTGP